MAVADLTPEEFEAFFSEEVSGLDKEAQEILRQYRVPSQRSYHAFHGRTGPAMAPVWIVARDGQTVLGYDEVEEEFGIGTLEADNHVGDWGTFGERLRWSLTHFVTSAARSSRPSE